jgi:hypothetical protein
MLHRLVRLSLFVGLVGCDVTGLDTRVTVVTDAERFTLPAQGQAMVTGKIHNGADFPVTFVGCPSPPSLQLEQFVAGNWQKVSDRGLICLAIFSASTVTLDPGAEMPFTISFWLPGEFRLRVHVGPKWGEPESTALSNTFRIQ